MEIVKAQCLCVGERQLSDKIEDNGYKEEALGKEEDITEEARFQ